jgi:DNA-binding protein
LSTRISPGNVKWHIARSGEKKYVHYILQYLKNFKATDPLIDLLVEGRLISQRCRYMRCEEVKWVKLVQNRVKKTTANKLSVAYIEILNAGTP